MILTEMSLDCFSHILSEFFSLKKQKSIDKKKCRELLMTKTGSVIDLLHQAQVLCELDALSFLPDDKKQELDEVKIAISTHRAEFQDLFLKNHLLDSGSISQSEWRVILGMSCTFLEWCTDVGFFDLNVFEQETALLEFPFDTLNLCIGTMR